MKSGSRTKFAVVLSVAAVVLVGIFILRNTMETRSDRASAAQKASPNQANKTALRGVTDFGPAGDQSGRMEFVRMPDQEDSASTFTADAEPEVPEPEENAKIGYVVHDFRDYQTLSEDYKLDGLELTYEGIVLAPGKEPAEGEEPEPRIGTIVSPTLELKHPSNMVAPIWREKTPEGTSLMIELALSPDGEDWSDWYPIDASGDEISPTYPDGRPNPNYGAVGGTAIANGLRMYPYVRYRVTLASQNEATPVLEELKVFHVDSTGDEGYLAQEPPGRQQPVGTEPVGGDAAGAEPSSAQPSGSEQPGAAAEGANQAQSIPSAE